MVQSQRYASLLSHRSKADKSSFCFSYHGHHVDSTGHKLFQDPRNSLNQNVGLAARPKTFRITYLPFSNTMPNFLHFSRTEVVKFRVQPLKSWRCLSWIRNEHGLLLKQHQNLPPMPGWLAGKTLIVSIQPFQISKMSLSASIIGKYVGSISSRRILHFVAPLEPQIFSKIPRVAAKPHTKKRQLSSLSNVTAPIPPKTAPMRSALHAIIPFSFASSFPNLRSPLPTNQFPFE